MGECNNKQYTIPGSFVDRSQCAQGCCRQPVAYDENGLVLGNGGGVTPRAHKGDGLTRPEGCTQSRAGATFTNNKRHRSLLLVDTGAGQGDGLCLQTGAVYFGCAGFVVLQSVKLRRLESPRGLRRV